MDMNGKLYSPEDIRRLEKKKKNISAALLITAVVTLAACVGLALLATTATAAAMERGVILLSGGLGCVWLYIRRFAAEETDHELAHARMLSGGEAEAVRGTLTVTEERLHIRNSITFRTVLLEDGGRMHHLKIIENRVKALRPLEGRQVDADVVNGYIAGVRAL